MKGGEELYDYLIEDTTTLPLKAAEVHQIGLDEVIRIKKEMEAIKEEVGFEGTLPEFFNHLRTDAKFKAESRDALRDGYYAIGKKVDARIAEQFSTIPESPLEIRAVEPFREKTAAGGSYQQGTPDGSRSGIFSYRSEEHTSELQSLMRISYAVFCLK